MEEIVGHDFSVSNEELLDLCKRQDQEALRVLFRRHERPVYNMLFRMLSSREDAEEALAEVFVKVWRGAASFKGDSKFTTWLFRIAGNTARDVLRARRVRPEVSIEDVVVDEVEAAERSHSHVGDPLKTTIEADEKARMLRAMADLAEDDRLLITLYHLQECDYEEIARITGAPPSNLKVKLFRARQRLRKLCASDEKEADNNELPRDTTESSGLQQGASGWV